MRCIFFVAMIAMLGCGRGKDPAALNTVSKPIADPVVALRSADEQAAFNFEAAGASIESALKAAKKLAPVAGGDAKEALLDVADMLDSAGATLADHTEGPPPISEYRKAENEQASERQHAVADALDALHELRDARGTLDTLAETVPSEHAKSLDAIRGQVDEAVSAVEDAIGRLGGKVPPEDEGDPPPPGDDPQT